MFKRRMIALKQSSSIRPRRATFERLESRQVLSAVVPMPAHHGSFGGLPNRPGGPGNGMPHESEMRSVNDNVEQGLPRPGDHQRATGNFQSFAPHRDVNVAGQKAQPDRPAGNIGHPVAARHDVALRDESLLRSHSGPASRGPLAPANIPRPHIRAQVNTSQTLGNTVPPAPRIATSPFQLAARRNVVDRANNVGDTVVRFDPPNSPPPTPSALGGVRLPHFQTPPVQPPRPLDQLAIRHEVGNGANVPAEPSPQPTSSESQIELNRPTEPSLIQPVLFAQEKSGTDAAISSTSDESLSPHAMELAAEPLATKSNVLSELPFQITLPAPVAGLIDIGSTRDLATTALDSELVWSDGQAVGEIVHSLDEDLESLLSLEWLRRDALEGDATKGDVLESDTSEDVAIDDEDGELATTGESDSPLRIALDLVEDSEAGGMIELSAFTEDIRQSLDLSDLESFHDDDLQYLAIEESNSKPTQSPIEIDEVCRMSQAFEIATSDEGFTVRGETGRAESSARLEAAAATKQSSKASSNETTSDRPQGRAPKHAYIWFKMATTSAVGLLLADKWKHRRRDRSGKRSK